VYAVQSRAIRARKMYQSCFFTPLHVLVDPRKVQAGPFFSCQTRPLKVLRSHYFKLLVEINWIEEILTACLNTGVIYRQLDIRCSVSMLPTGMLCFRKGFRAALSSVDFAWPVLGILCTIIRCKDILNMYGRIWWVIYPPGLSIRLKWPSPSSQTDLHGVGYLFSHFIYLHFR
jgi:hypothetical protein